MVGCVYTENCQIYSRILCVRVHRRSQPLPLAGQYMSVSQCIRANRFICVYLGNRKCSLRVVSVATCTGKFHPHHHTCPSLISWSLSLLAAEPAEGSRGHAEAAAPCEAPRAEQEEPGAGDPELQGGGPETAQDHLPAGEGARPLHQRSQ